MRSWLLLFSCNLMWALQFTCVKLVQDQVGPWVTVWGPMTLATLMLYPLIRAENRDSYKGKERSPKDILLFFMLALVGVFPGQVLITWGTRMSLASNAALLMLTLPVSHRHPGHHFSPRAHDLGALGELFAGHRRRADVLGP